MDERAKRLDLILIIAILAMILSAALLWTNQEVTQILETRSGGSCGVGYFTKGADGVCVPVPTPGR